MKRRTFLYGSSIAAAGLAAAGSYSLKKGIRYPGLFLDPDMSDAPLMHRQVLFNSQDVIATPSDNTNAELRAVVPEPVLHISNPIGQAIRFVVHNLSPELVLNTTSTALKETVEGLHRFIEIPQSVDEITLSWRFADSQQYRFAAIGDTGGGQELAWCLDRAAQLGARFLLHLGDFNYAEGDYEQATALFRDAPIPCFVSIGNHDFKDNGRDFRQFINHIGPLNQQFSLGGVRYLNIDTAANFLPASGGQRGRVLQHILGDTNNYADNIVFTHRPLFDPMENSTHDMGREAERDWLLEQLQRAKVSTLLAGHIHIFDDGEFAGIRQIIAGQGLGHQDLITNNINTSKMVIGKVDAKHSNSNKVEFEFASLAMPMAIHCHPRVEEVKLSLPDSPAVALTRQHCQK